MSNNPYISMRNVSKRYGEYLAVEDVSFDIAQGEIVALIGPNGSGKSTLAKLLIGLEKPTAGEIRVAGDSPERAHRHIGYVPQIFSFDRSLPLTVKEFLQLASCQHTDHSDSDNVERGLEQVGLLGIEKKQMGHLSGGQLQRVLIARALMHERDVLLLDEPSASIDAPSEVALYHLLHTLSEEHGVTTILISHELDFVFAHATQVICMNRRLMCRGVPKEVLTKDVLASLYGNQVRHYEHEEKGRDHHSHHQHL